MTRIIVFTLQSSLAVFVVIGRTLSGLLSSLFRVVYQHYSPY